MSLQNIIIHDNAVVISITGLDSSNFPNGLNDFDKITATYGSDERNTIDNPQSVVITSDTELNLFFGDTTETANLNWSIFGEKAAFPNKIQLTNACMGNLGRTKRC